MIEGTAGCASVEGVGGCLPIYTPGPIRIGLVVPPETSIPLPPRVWLGVKFDRHYAGVIGGAPALHGFSSDVYDASNEPCDADLGGFPDHPHASFNAQVSVDAACADTHLTYQNIGASTIRFNPARLIAAPTITVQLMIDNCLRTKALT